MNEESGPISETALTSPAASNQGRSLHRHVTSRVREFWRLVLGPIEVPSDAPFFALGGDSQSAIDLMLLIDEEFPGCVEALELFSAPTVEELSRLIVSRLQARAVTDPGDDIAAPTRAFSERQDVAPFFPKGPIDGPRVEPTEGPAAAGIEQPRRPSPKLTAPLNGPSDVAVIGLACRFPGASTPEAYWDLLREGVDAISAVPTARRLLWTASADAAQAAYRGGFLTDIEAFDHAFFHISQREAKALDPQQRILLEVGWELLEDTGYADPTIKKARAGVFVGATKPDYDTIVGQAAELNGGLVSLIANRLSYFFDLRGPSEVIDTACSSSLVAIHRACQSLRLGECEMAIAGGVNLLVTPTRYRLMTRNGMLSPEGECHPFDARANGMVPGEGAGLVLLKLLDRALADNDSIYAVIKGSAVGNDGRTNGINAPNPESQTDVILEAWRSAGVSPSTISYIEAHGTGTPLGDPIELRALTDAYRRSSGLIGECGIGSVKAQIGHLEWAAGVAGVIKVILALMHGQLPASLHYREPNPQIDLSRSPFRVVDSLRPWRGSEPLRAGVSSFGVGGTNCHVVIEQAPQTAATSSPPSFPHLLTLSARTHVAIQQRARNLYRHLTTREAWSVGDVCASMNLGRGLFRQRAAAVVATKQEPGDCGGAARDRTGIPRTPSTMRGNSRALWASRACRGTSPECRGL
ncbi:MAG: hypothetical protein E6J01_00200 [Chloroflexi bacterium]|nr:MAG: hypothetical protein E6J01_00200 [Chloroflexota bacterium]